MGIVTMTPEELLAEVLRLQAIEKENDEQNTIIHDQADAIADYTQRLETIETAARAMFDRWTGVAESGDCGNWMHEDPAYIALGKALNDSSVNG